MRCGSLKIGADEAITSICVLLCLFPLISNLNYRSIDVDNARNEGLSGEEVGWPVISVITHFGSQMLNLILDLIWYFHDKSTMDALFMCNRAIIIVAGMVAPITFVILKACNSYTIAHWMSSLVSASLICTFYVILCRVLVTSSCGIFREEYMTRLHFLSGIYFVFSNMFSATARRDKGGGIGLVIVTIHWGLFVVFTGFYMYFTYQYIRINSIIPTIRQMNNETIVMLSLFTPYVMMGFYGIYWLIFNLFFRAEDMWTGEVGNIYFNMFQILISIPILIIPEKIARAKLNIVKTSLMKTAHKISADIHPKILELTSSLHALQNPRVLREVFLDDDFQRHFKILSMTCENLRCDVEEMKGTSHSPCCRRPSVPETHQLPNPLIFADASSSADNITSFYMSSGSRVVPLNDMENEPDDQHNSRDSLYPRSCEDPFCAESTFLPLDTEPCFNSSELPVLENSNGHSEVRAADAVLSGNVTSFYDDCSGSRKFLEEVDRYALFHILTLSKQLPEFVFLKQSYLRSVFVCSFIRSIIFMHSFFIFIKFPKWYIVCSTHFRPTFKVVKVSDLSSYAGSDCCNIR